MAKPASIRRVAVLGAGVMGAQIAAHCVNAQIPTVLFDLASPGDLPHKQVNQAIAKLQKLKPAPLSLANLSEYIYPATYETDLERLHDCDLIIEAVAERIDIKADLYQQIAEYIHPEAVLASNTSGISINQLAHVLPEQLRPRFLGMHFFNPPRYMRLVELIPAATTEADIVDFCETWLVKYLGKGVVRAHDTPNFIANRIGVFSLLITIHHAQAFGLSFDVVDKLTGTAIGRPKSATFRTMDVVGLDTMAHVINTMKEALQDDPWHDLFQNPSWCDALISQGAIGQKAGAGIYKKDKSGILVLDPEQMNYVAQSGAIAADVKAILAQTSSAEKWRQLRQCEHPQAQFLWAMCSDLLHYSAYYAQTIADDLQAVDQAMCWGFGWQQGPFALWQELGWDEVANWLTADIAAEKTFSKAELPAWVSATDAAFSSAGAYSPSQASYVSARQLPVYKNLRQPAGEIILEDDNLCVRNDEDVAVINFKTKLNIISPALIASLQQAIAVAEAQCKALIIHQHDSDNFSAGADLTAFADAQMRADSEAVIALLHEFQKTVMALRYARIPTIAALSGRALGGGAELLLHCRYHVAALESYVGLVEIGVGLLPAGGGCTRFAAAAAHNADPVQAISDAFATIAMAKVSASASQAQALGFLPAQTPIVMHAEQLYQVALALAHAHATHYRPALPDRFAVLGRAGIANCQTQLANLRRGEFISEHDQVIALQIATILCGGEVDPGTIVDEAWLLKLEREAFARLAQLPATQARIEHMLKTGKPLRN